MDEKRKKLVARLNRIFPHLILANETYLFDNDNDCVPEEMLSWSDIIDDLEKNGLTIMDKKTL